MLSTSLKYLLSTFIQSFMEETDQIRGVAASGASWILLLKHHIHVATYTSPQYQASHIRPWALFMPMILTRIWFHTRIARPRWWKTSTRTPWIRSNDLQSNHRIIWTFTSQVTRFRWWWLRFGRPSWLWPRTAPLFLIITNLWLSIHDTTSKNCFYIWERDRLLIVLSSTKFIKQSWPTNQGNWRWEEGMAEVPQPKHTYICKEIDAEQIQRCLTTPGSLIVFCQQLVQPKYRLSSQLIGCE